MSTRPGKTRTRQSLKHGLKNSSKIGKEKENTHEYEEYLRKLKILEEIRLKKLQALELLSESDLLLLTSKLSTENRT